MKSLRVNYNAQCIIYVYRVQNSYFLDIHNSVLEIYKNYSCIYNKLILNFIIKYYLIVYML